MLCLQGYPIRVAYSGPAALAQALSLQPATMRLGIGMPALSGYKLSQKVREQLWAADRLGAE